MILILRVCWNGFVNDEICILNSNSVSSIRGGSCDGQIIKKKCDLNCYFVSLLITTLKMSIRYKHLVAEYLIKRLQIRPFSRARLKIAMYPGKHLLDRRW